MEQEGSNRSKGNESKGFGDFEADLSVVIEPVE